MPGAQKLRGEAHLQGALQRRSLSTTPQMDFLRDHQDWKVEDWACHGNLKFGNLRDEKDGTTERL
jgi:hypothetical protein